MDWNVMLQTTIRGTRGMASPTARRFPVPMATTWGSSAMNHVMRAGSAPPSPQGSQDHENGAGLQGKAKRRPHPVEISGAVVVAQHGLVSLADADEHRKSHHEDLATMDRAATAASP